MFGGRYEGSRRPERRELRKAELLISPMPRANATGAQGAERREEASRRREDELRDLRRASFLTRAAGEESFDLNLR